MWYSAGQRSAQVLPKLSYNKVVLATSVYIGGLDVTVIFNIMSSNFTMRRGLVLT